MAEKIMRQRFGKNQKGKGKGIRRPVKFGNSLNIIQVNFTGLKSKKRRGGGVSLERGQC